MIQKGTISTQTLQNAIRQQINEKDKKIGELIIKDGKAKAKNVAEALRIQREANIETSNTISQTDISTIKVNSVKLDNLLDTVGELVIAYVQASSNGIIKNSKEPKINKDFNQLKRVVTDLQKISMSLRMIEIKQTFQKLTRLVRDLSKKSKKPIELIIKGENTEIDRSIVDDIYEPLVHILRNAIDHGIENEDERISKNKDIKGTINLSAYHQGGNVVIEVEDDGKGLDKDRILQKAIEKGAVAADEELDEDDIYRLIFLSGFSTAKEVTDVSGRGMGMDIVEEKIKRLRGKIEIYSEKDIGAKFILRIPLTMAIIDGMIIAIGENKYVLPTLNVMRIFKLDDSKYFTFKKQAEMVNIDGKLIPLIRLYKLLNIKSQITDPQDALLILVESMNKQKCFMVDNIIDKQEVVVKSLGDKLKEVEGIAAGTILGDGKVGLILDIDGIFSFNDNNKQDLVAKD